MPFCAGGDDSDDDLYIDGFDMNMKDRLWDGSEMGPNDNDDVAMDREKLEKMNYLLQQQVWGLIADGCAAR